MAKYNPTFSAPRSVQNSFGDQLRSIKDSYAKERAIYAKERATKQAQEYQAQRDVLNDARQTARDKVLDTRAEDQFKRQLKHDKTRYEAKATRDETLRNTIKDEQDLEALNLAKAQLAVSGGPSTDMYTIEDREDKSKILSTGYDTDALMKAIEAKKLSPTGPIVPEYSKLGDLDREAGLYFRQIDSSSKSPQEKELAKREYMGARGIDLSQEDYSGASKVANVTGNLASDYALPAIEAMLNPSAALGRYVGKPIAAGVQSVVDYFSDDATTALTKGITKSKQAVTDAKTQLEVNKAKGLQTPYQDYITKVKGFQNIIDSNAKAKKGYDASVKAYDQAIESYKTKNTYDIKGVQVVKDREVFKSQEAVRFKAKEAQIDAMAIPEVTKAQAKLLLKQESDKALLSFDTLAINRRKGQDKALSERAKKQHDFDVISAKSSEKQIVTKLAADLKKLVPGTMEYKLAKSKLKESKARTAKLDSET